MVRFGGLLDLFLGYNFDYQPITNANTSITGNLSSKSNNSAGLNSPLRIKANNMSNNNNNNASNISMNNANNTSHFNTSQKINSSFLY